MFVSQSFTKFIVKQLLVFYLYFMALSNNAQQKYEFTRYSVGELRMKPILEQMDNTQSISWWSRILIDNRKNLFALFFIASLSLTPLLEETKWSAWTES